jgi:hypothetical protein
VARRRAVAHENGRRIVIRSFLRRLFAEPTSAERLARLFPVHPDHAQRALDRVGGDEHRATLILLYGAANARSVYGAIEDLFSVPGFDGVQAWADSVEGRRVWLAWQMAQPAPASLRLRATGKIDRWLRGAWLEAARRGAERAAGDAS